MKSPDSVEVDEFIRHIKIGPTVVKLPSKLLNASLVQTAQAARDTAAWAYDATADTSSSAMNRVRGKQDPEPTYTQRAADAARRVRYSGCHISS